MSQPKRKPGAAITTIKPRNRKLETEREQLSFFHEMADLYDQRSHGGLTEIWQVAQSLIVCGLPYDEVKDTQWEKTARLGDGSHLTVTFAATKKGVSLPFGQDRGPLLYLINKAIERYFLILNSMPANVSDADREKLLDQARFVRWDEAKQYLDAMNLGSGGADYERLALRMKRIRSCAISVIRTSSEGDEDSLLVPIVRSSRLPRWAKDNKSRSRKGVSSISGLMNTSEGQSMGFELGRDFFKDFIQHHVPVPTEVIRKLIGKPKYLDLFVFLCWRSYAAKSVSEIPLTELQKQLGSKDSNTYRLANDIQNVIKLSKNLGWKELNAEVSTDFTGRKVLKIGKPINNVHFLPPQKK